MNKYLIAGLGNIGTEYAGTRHNIGFDVVDAFAFKHEGLFVQERLGAISKLRLKGKQVVLLKPSTFMNLSGKAVKYWLDKEDIPLENLLVIVDEVALPLNKIRIRPGGSAAGHNGLLSIEESLKTTNYPRLRFGIGNTYPRGMQVEYVLGRWTSQELSLAKIKLEKTVEAVETFILAGIDTAMNQYNNLLISL
jgi:PTH1 family peptidyl-tRNA hydrolase